MNDIPQQILEQLQKNELYLQKIAETQAQALEINRKTLETERYRVYIMGLKLVFIVVLTWVSFVLAKNLTENLTSNLNGLMGGSATNLELGGASDLANELRGSQELIREIMGQ
jgi:hypothetical protein